MNKIVVWTKLFDGRDKQKVERTIELNNNTESEKERKLIKKR